MFHQVFLNRGRFSLKELYYVKVTVMCAIDYIILLSCFLYGDGGANY